MHLLHIYFLSFFILFSNRLKFTQIALSQLCSQFDWHTRLTWVSAWCYWRIHHLKWIMIKEEDQIGVVVVVRRNGKCRKLVGPFQGFVFWNLKEVVQIQWLRTWVELNFVRGRHNTFSGLGCVKLIYSHFIMYVSFVCCLKR